MPNLKDSAFLAHAMELMNKALKRGRWVFVALNTSALVYLDGESSLEMDKMMELGYRELGCSKYGRNDLPQGIGYQGGIITECQDCKRKEQGGTA